MPHNKNNKEAENSIVIGLKSTTKGGFFSERADAFVISPNRQT